MSCTFLTPCCCRNLIWFSWEVFQSHLEHFLWGCGASTAPQSPEPRPGDITLPVFTAASPNRAASCLTVKHLRIPCRGSSTLGLALLTSPIKVSVTEADVTVPSARQVHHISSVCRLSSCSSPQLCALLGLYNYVAFRLNSRKWFGREGPCKTLWLILAMLRFVAKNLVIIVIVRIELWLPVALKWFVDYAHFWWKQNC